VLVLAAIGGGAFVLASLVVSLRLLALARHTRQLPEFLIGLGLLLMGGIGYPLSTLARLIDGPALQAGLFAFHALLSLVGQSAVALFTWRVFRRDEAWARTFAVGFMVLMSALMLWQTADPGWAAYAQEERGPWGPLLPAFSLVVLGWAGIESLLYYQKLRKRLALGLAEAVTTDRLRLWAVAMLAAFMTSLLVQVVRSMGVAMTGSVTGLIVGPLGIVSASAMWLAFLPPQRYVDWVLARAGAARV
jgi:hypothetical protein